MHSRNYTSVTTLCPCLAVLPTSVSLPIIVSFLFYPSHGESGNHAHEDDVSARAHGYSYSEGERVLVLSIKTSIRRMHIYPTYNLRVRPSLRRPDHPPRQHPGLIYTKRFPPLLRGPPAAPDCRRAYLPTSVDCHHYSYKLLRAVQLRGTCGEGCVYG